MAEAAMCFRGPAKKIQADLPSCHAVSLAQVWILSLVAHVAAEKTAGTSALPRFSVAICYVAATDLSDDI